MASVSILVLVLNEEIHLPACLQSVEWSDDVHVVDSGSSDRTVEWARTMGARVHVHQFENFSRQRNWALDNVPFRHEWLLVLDADEVVPPELAEEIERVVSGGPPGVHGFRLRREVHFLGRPIRHAGQFSSFWFLRIFRRGSVRYEDRRVNAHPLTEGETATLQNHLLHNNRKGVMDLMEKFARYALLEAEEFVESQEEEKGRAVETRRTGSPEERRRRLKRLAARLPNRGLLKFVYLYVYRRGFLDGGPGFFYSALMAAQEFLSASAVGCLRRGLPVR